MNIIVIDDEYASLSVFLSNIVDAYNLKYTMFMNNPKSCVEYVKQNQTDAAFVDIVMPDMDGVTLAQQLVAASPDISIVFISGFTQDEEAIRQKLGNNLVGFCYKPYTQDMLMYNVNEILTRKSRCRRVEVKTFACFDVFLDGKPIKFSSAKSKELFAFLIDKRGATVSMSSVLASLWSDKDTDLAKRLYRDAVFRLRMVLNENKLGDLVNFGRAQLILDTGKVDCDSWDFIDGLHNDYKGQYLPTYEWSIETQNYLDNIMIKRGYKSH